MSEKLVVNGWLPLHKPKGITSARAVSIVKRRLNVKKVGHAGTLDPLASGVLPLAIGEATKTVSYAMLSEKSYDFTVKWGEDTETCDAEGAVIATSDVRPNKQQILSVIGSFIGEIEQAPPAYSAIKIKGKRAYDLARKGEVVEIAPRKIHIHSFELVECDENSARFNVSCGKGTYVRSLAVDIAEKLGTKCHVIELIRTKVGKFFINDTILLEEFDKKVYSASVLELVLPVDEVLDDIPVLAVSSEEASDLRQGKKVFLDVGSYNLDDIVSVKSDTTLIALVRICEGFIKTIRVFNL